MEREVYMKRALELGNRAMETGDVPVGCVVVRDGKIIGEGYNTREADGNPLGHAECQAILQASKVVGGWNLHGCQLFVTLEPCPMCAGAIINSRIDSVYYGAKDQKGGACGSVLNLFMEDFNHKPKVYGGILAEACTQQLQEFFRKLREKK